MKRTKKLLALILAALLPGANWADGQIEDLSSVIRKNEKLAPRLS